MCRTLARLILTIALGFAFAFDARADVLAMGTGLTSLEFVEVGNPGNPGQQSLLGEGDATYYGGVAGVYGIGKFEVTNAQWRAFLTAKASQSDPHGLYNTGMAGTAGGIDQTWVDDHYVYTAKGGDAAWDNRPVTYVSFWDAARFCNWLHNGQGDGDTESGAYLNLGDQATFARQAGAEYFLPTENEWYKAAYHKNDGATGNYFLYPTGRDAAPVNTVLTPDPGNRANYLDSEGTGTETYTIGKPYYTTPVGEFENSASPYGTFDQGGNVWEWNETAIGSSRGVRGGGYTNSTTLLAATTRGDVAPTGETSTRGFRVATSAVDSSPDVPGDANGDGKVNDLDASILAANWQRTGGATRAQADFNADGKVDDLDASILASNWQYGTAAVPEPGTPALLAGLAAASLVALRRNRLR